MPDPTPEPSAQVHLENIEAHLDPAMDTFNRGAGYIRKVAWPCACGFDKKRSTKEPCACTGWAREEVAEDLEDHHEELAALLTHIARLRARVEELEEVLEPFRDAALLLDEREWRDSLLSEIVDADAFRRARTALSDTEEGRDE